MESVGDGSTNRGGNRTEFKGEQGEPGGKDAQGTEQTNKNNSNERPSNILKGDGKGGVPQRRGRLVFFALNGRKSVRRAVTNH